MLEVKWNCCVQLSEVVYYTANLEACIFHGFGSFIVLFYAQHLRKV